MNLNCFFENSPNIEIEQLSIDSRLPMKNAIFFCLDGIKYDGHNFVDDAIKNGAVVIVYSKDIKTNNNAIYIKVKNVNETLYKIADLFYNHPNNGINKYLISGCYGRSTVSSIIFGYINTIDKCGSVGTFGINYSDKHLDITFPALTSLENIKLLDKFKKEKILNAVFESSIISLYYKKMDVIKPDVFVYTNTSKYCSDYKVCNNHYYEYLGRYLYTLEDKTCVLFNGDDESYNELNRHINNYKTYGQNEYCDYRISNIQLFIDKSYFELNVNNVLYKIETKLLGLNNVYNCVAAIAALNIKGYLIDDIIKYLKNMNCIDGVIEKINDNLNIFIDCGYELDSLKNIMEYAYSTRKGRIIGVLGINSSDSDERIKQISKLCDNYLDITIFTEDESLQEEVLKILERTDKFIKSKNVLHIQYRSIAIENAINIMRKNDTLLILGKGNEKYLTMGLGKERYLGDKHYALKYIQKRMEEQNEII